MLGRHISQLSRAYLLARSCSGDVAASVKNEGEVGEGKLEFRKLQLLPVREERQRRIRKRYQPVARSAKILPTQDWPSVWPTAQSFKASVVPLPVRMGWALTRKHAPPSKTANLELMKIPNFLHLTPVAIKRHCQAIKKFCSPWPEGLEDGDERLPLEFITTDYCHAGSSIRDPRARIVTISIKLSALKLDYHAKDKLLRLVGDRYDKKTDTLTIVTDRCPARQQNRDYAIYLLTALYFESLKREPWESEKTEADMEKTFWDGSRCQKQTFDVIRRMRDACKAEQDEETKARIFPAHVRSLIDAKASDEELRELSEMKRYYDAWDRYRNEDETAEAVARYGKTVRDLLGVPSLAGGIDEHERVQSGRADHRRVREARSRPSTRPVSSSEG